MKRKRSSAYGKEGRRMKSKFTKNIGLKILSVVAAFFLWLVVVNVDDPVISRTYTGIDVELLNTEILEADGKCYEIANNTDTVNVVVSAKRSVLDEMSKDYIKATADFALMTHSGNVPIDVKSTRYSDKIESVTTRTEYVSLILEDIVEKDVIVSIVCEGNIDYGYVLADTATSVDVVNVSGPESVVDNVRGVVATANITGLRKDAVVNEMLIPCDESGKPIEDDRLVLSVNSAEITLTVNGVKEIPVSCGYSGNPISGYTVAGNIITNPSSVQITGRGENYDDIDVIYISPDDVSIEGAMADVSMDVNISDYLPTGVSFASSEFSPVISVTVPIAPTEHKVISVPLSNITVENIPEGYIANIVDTGGVVNVEIQGLGDTYDRYSGELAIGAIEASAMVPRNINPEAESAPLQTGENDGIVVFDLPTGITVVNPVSLMVIVDYVGGEGVSNTISSEAHNTVVENVVDDVAVTNEASEQ